MPKVTKQSVKKKTPRRKKVSIADRIRSVSFDDIGVSINLYGKSGTGKTTLWSTFPTPILALVCSGAGETSGELRSIGAERLKRIRQLTIEGTDDIRQVVEAITIEELRLGSIPFKTVVLDHATDLQHLCLKEILGLEELPAQLGWGIAKQQEWGQCALQMKELLRAILSLKINRIIIAQERDFTPEDNPDGILEPYVASALTPSVVGWLNPACDYVCQTFIRHKTVEKEIKVGKVTRKRKVPTDQVEYCLRTAPSAVYASKFRVPKGGQRPQVLVDPNYSKLMALIEGKQNASPVQKRRPKANRGRTKR